MRNKVQKGDRLTWQNETGAAVLAGALVVAGGVLAVASTDIADGASGELDPDGVFSLPKGAGEAWAVGDVLM